MQVNFCQSLTVQEQNAHALVIQNQLILDARYTQFNYASVWHVLGVAALLGDIQNINNIVTQLGITLLNRGNSHGWSPLFCAAITNNHQAGLAAVQALIRRGANLNLATHQGLGPYEYNIYFKSPLINVKDRKPKGATPLFAAVEITQNKRLAKLLLKNGAIVPDANTQLIQVINGQATDVLARLSERGNALVTQIKQEIDKEFLFFNIWYHDTNPQKIPAELVKTILNYAQN